MGAIAHQLVKGVQANYDTIWYKEVVKCKGSGIFNGFSIDRFNWF